MNENGTGQFDAVYQDTNGKFIVVEAKGGASSLGSRTVNKKKVMQGTKEYFEDIIKQMSDQWIEARDFERARNAVGDNVIADNNKLSRLNGFQQGSTISKSDLKIDVLKSKQNDNSIVESVINYY